MADRPKVEVILFKRSGKYYTTDEWRRAPEGYDYMGPASMQYSPDFRRIDAGGVVVTSQEPWGFPVLFPPETMPPGGWY